MTFQVKRKFNRFSSLKLNTTVAVKLVNEYIRFNQAGSPHIFLDEIPGLFQDCGHPARSWLCYYSKQVSHTCRRVLITTTD